MSTKRTDQENSGIVVSQAFAQGTAPTANDGAVWTDTSLVPTDYSRPDFRNAIINGDFRIAQRGTSFSAQTNGRYTLDRWNIGGVGSSTLAVSRIAGPPGTAYAIRATVGITQASLGAGDYQQMTTYLEGYDINKYCFGTSFARTLYLSFWARSSITGTFGVNIRNMPNAYSYVVDYSISAANTWTKVEIIFSGATVGTWLGDHRMAMEIGFTFGSGTNYKTATQNSWVSGNYIASTTATANLMATASATFDISMVQLETEGFSTFERRPMAIEQELCERYYQRLSVPASVNAVIADAGSDTTGWWGVLHLSTPLRVVPTMEQSGTFRGGSRPDTGTSGTLSIDSGGTGATSLHIISLRLEGGGPNSTYGGYISALGSAYIGLIAE